jgi:hypothetical protein
MDWYKVKVSHTLYDGMTDRELAGWTRIMALTAHLECMPNREQMLSQCGSKTLAKVEQSFINVGTTLHECLSKVIEDADEVKTKREYNKIKKRQSREKLLNVNLTCQNESLTVPSKIREDKIREEDIVKYIPKDFQLANHRTVASLLNYIERLEIEDSKKKDIKISIQSAAKQPHDIWELWELIETSLCSNKDAKKTILRGA